MQHLLPFACIESRTLRCLVVLVHVPVIVGMVVLNVLEGFIRAAHDIAISLLVSSSAASQMLGRHLVTSWMVIGKDVRTVLKGSNA